MDAAVFMRVVQSECELFQIPLDLLKREPATAQAVFCQRATGHVGHHDIGQLILFTVGIDGQDIGMTKFARRFGLVQETPVEVPLHTCIQVPAWQEDLDSHLSFGLLFLSKKDSAGTAVPQQSLQSTGAKPLPDKMLSSGYGH